MDVQNLLVEAKARFSHNSAKQYLKEKYSNSLLVAEQGGLWLADPQTISLLQTFKSKKIILIDTKFNPVEVNRAELLEKLKEVYTSVSQEYFKEWKELESKK